MSTYNRQQNRGTFFNIAFFCEILQNTAAEDGKALAIFEDWQQMGLLLGKQALAITSKSPAQSKARALDAIITVMADYLSEYPAPPVYRQKMWDTFFAWTGRISAALGLQMPMDFEDSIPRPAVKDTGIALVTALHDNAGKTKRELGEELGVSTKSIQTNLRALCPSLQEGGTPAAPLRVGGQEMLVQIECEADPQTGERKYHTENRLHPLVLQLNTMQVGELIRALSTLDDEEDNIVCREMSVDVWSQLSQPGKDRLNEIYGEYYDGFIDFTEYLEEECENRLLRFRTEAEMIRRLTKPEQLFAVYKGNELCTLRLHREGEDCVLKRVHVRRDFDVKDVWLAEPEDGGETIRFSIDELRVITLIQR